MKTDYSDLVKVEQLEGLVLRVLRGQSDAKRIMTAVRDCVTEMKAQIIFLRNEREKLLGMVDETEKEAAHAKA